MTYPYYPAFLNLQGKKCIVIGGGAVAERKVMSILRCGAVVKVISPLLTKRLQQLKMTNAIKHINRRYRTGDLKDAFLVIAATSDYSVNKKIADESACLVNVVDTPELANFIVPSAINNGPLTIAVSTSGASPAMARTIKSELKSLYNKDFGRFTAYLKNVRAAAIKEIPDTKKRRGFLKDIAAGDIMRILRERGYAEAKERVNKHFSTIKTGELK